MKRRVPTVIAVVVVVGALGAAFAASTTSETSSGITAQALSATKVTLLAAAPGNTSAPGPVAVASAAALPGGVTRSDLARALYARLDVGGHRATFAVDHTAAMSGKLVLRVVGAPGASVSALAPVDVLARDLYEASKGYQPLVLLARGQGAGAVTFAVYDPAMPYSGMPVAGAEQATVWVNGRPSSYRVQPGSHTLSGLVIASGSMRGQKLAAVVG